MAALFNYISISYKSTYILHLQQTPIGRDFSVINNAMKI